MSSESVMPTNHLILHHPLFLLLSNFPSIRVFPKESALRIRWSKYWSFSFSNSLSSEYSGLISFRIDWFDLLAVQGILKSVLQHHSLKALIFQCSAFFMVQLSHLCVTTGKTTALTIWTFVIGKVMSLLVNMLLRFVIPFLPWSKRLLISWLQSLPAVILEPKKIKFVTASTFSPSICQEVMVLDAMIWFFWLPLMAQLVKNLPAMQETQVQSLDRKDPLEKAMATYSSILVWEILWTEEPGRLQTKGSQRVRHDWG